MSIKIIDPFLEDRYNYIQQNKNFKILQDNVISTYILFYQNLSAIQNYSIRASILKYFHELNIFDLVREGLYPLDIICKIFK